MNLNKVLLIGNVTRDPEMRTTPSGQTVTTVGLATNRTWNNKQTGEKQTKAEFHNIVCWGRLAEIAGQYLKKGASAYFEGRIETRSWQDAKTNEKKYRTEIIAENLQLGPRPQGGGDYSGRAGAARDSKAETDSAPMEDLPIIQEDEPEIEVKDIPF